MKWILSTLLFLILTSTSFAQEFNAGFVQGLWYQDGGVYADTPTRIYVAVRNNTGSDLTGTVEFFDNDERIERNNVSALDGRIIESWTDWTPTYGDHTITATISRIELHKVGSSTQAIEVVSASASDSFFVDYDTDKDNIGNKEDSDDDNDGISDENEIKNGTDPQDATDPAPKLTNEDEDSDSIDEEDGSSRGGSEASAPEETGQTNSPQGLEKYVNDGQGDSILYSFTNTINNTKKQIDDYRTERNNRIYSDSDTSEAQAPQDEEKSSSTVSSVIFSTSSAPTESSYKTVVGNINTNDLSESLKETVDEDTGIFTKIIDLTKAITGSLFTLVLFLLSIYLANPVIVQLTLLILILILIYKVARRLGNRRNY